MSTPPRWHVLADAAALQAEASARVLAAAERSLARRGAFHIVLAGGNTPRGSYEQLRAARTDWARWHIYFGDERCLPPGDPQRNSAMARTAWLDHVSIPAGQIHDIPAELGPQEGARRYARILANVPDFDCVLLGLGEDGHTASLFPGDATGLALDAADALPVLGAPKPPPQRITLSAQRLSRALSVLFLVTGSGKQEAVARWRAGKDPPAAHIQPRAGADVLLDTAADGS